MSTSESSPARLSAGGRCLQRVLLGMALAAGAPLPVLASVAAHATDAELGDALDVAIAHPSTSADLFRDSLELGPRERTMVPQSVLALPSSIAHVLVADLSANRLYLYAHEAGDLTLLRAMFLSIGKQGYGKEVEGDNLSPVGIYTVTRWIPGQELPPLYGDGAWPVDYPNPLDRMLGRTGYGIWLHGNPPENGGIRGPRSSEGCITLANADLTSLEPFIHLQRTTVVFADRVTWVDRGTRAQRAEHLTEALQQWTAAWETGDADELAAMYSADARIAGLTRDQLREQKRAVNAYKDWIRVGVDEIAAYVYPGSEGRMMQVDFTQRYESSNYQSLAPKRQYWRLDDDGQWRIVLEIPDYQPG
ncbi:MAG: L,D-transpeptidase family protein [Oceanococcaceae bacterium]